MNFVSNFKIKKLLYDQCFKIGIITNLIFQLFGKVQFGIHTFGLFNLVLNYLIIQFGHLC